MSKKNEILVVDDDQDLRETISRFLEVSGYSVQQASNGKEALKILRNSAPDLVITDIFMPDKDGISTVIDIKRINEDIDIIAMSGGGRFKRMDMLKAAQEFGADASLSKPFDFNDLLNMIKDILDGGAASEEQKTVM